MKQRCVVCRSGESPASLEVRIKAEEEVLAEAFRAAEVSRLADPPPLEPSEPLILVSSVIQPLVSAPPVLQAAAAEPHLVPVCDEESLLASQAATGQRNSHSDLKSAEQMMRLVSLLRNWNSKIPQKKELGFTPASKDLGLALETRGGKMTSQTSFMKHLTCICLLIDISPGNISAGFYCV